MANPQGFADRNPCLLMLVFAGSRMALRLARGERLADVAVPDLSFVVLALCARWSRLSPPGSAARRWAGFGICVATCSIILGIPWVAIGPPAFNLEAGVIWGMAVFFVLALLCFYMFIFYWEWGSDLIGSD